MSYGIELRQFKEIDLRGGTVVVGIPSVGLVGPIVASHLVGALALDQVCALESEDFPPVSMIYAGKPKHPVRIFASPERKVAVFLAEFDPPPELARPIAYTILDWAEQHGIARIIAAEGFQAISPDPDEDGIVEPVLTLAGIGSTEEARHFLARGDVPTFDEGTVTGVAGVLLNEGRWRRRDVIALLGAAAKQEEPDSHAAAVVLATIAKLLPDLKLDVEPLDFEVPKVEGRVKTARKQAQPALATKASVPTKLARDPVCGMLIVPEAAAATVTVDGRTYYLCSKECADKFRKDPKGFVEHPEFA
jgi:uncharacterized protein